MARNARGDLMIDIERQQQHTGIVHRLFQVLSYLVVFMAGILFGLLSSSGSFNQHFMSRAELFLSADHAGPRGVAPVGGCTIVEAEDCMSMGRFLSPKKVTHTMSDEELLWRGSMVPRKKEYPYKRVPKVAFLFLTRGPLPLLPLWERFFHGQRKDLYNIYIHAPPRYQLNVSRDSMFFGREIPSQDVEWGTVRLTDAERRLLSNALLDHSNERFVLLSESCIPVYNFPTVYEYLTSSDHSFVNIYDDPSGDGRGRYSPHMQPRITLEQWRKGSQWFEMDRDLAARIVGDTEYYDLFRKYCKPACYPDEHYIPTYLHIFHGTKSANRSLTYVDWSHGGPHPARFEAEMVTEKFVRSIRDNGTLCSYNSGVTSLCYLFARKFAPNALEPLLNLSSSLMEF
ncbi:hypothetical protein SAY86_001055 [Trapa natans]|uniref:Uncharacterized protein n=1 Tax=Trapa natans TaxID=22666 RepID=A0AAN7MQD7_TRANT|nr:hypothetical protein SAY86_001055 [Trapa natans]